MRRLTRLPRRRGRSLAAPATAPRPRCGSPARAAAWWRWPRARAAPTPSSPRVPARSRSGSCAPTAARATSLGAFGVPGADYADVAAGAAGPLIVFARPTTAGYAYESTGLGAAAALGQGTGAPVLALDGTTRIAAYPDDDGDAAISRDGATTVLTSTGPALRTTPLDAVVSDGSPLVLARVQSRTRSQLRVLGPGAPGRAGRLGPRAAAARGLDHPRRRGRSTSPTATARGGSCSPPPRRAPAPAGRAGGCACAGTLNGAPAVARAGLRTIVATSQRVGRRYRIFLTTVGPAGAFLRPAHARGRIRPRPARRDRPGRPRLRRPGPTARAVARAAPRCCAECSEAAVAGGRFGSYDRTPA